MELHFINPSSIIVTRLNNFTYRVEVLLTNEKLDAIIKFFQNLFTTKTPPDNHFF